MVRKFPRHVAVAITAAVLTATAANSRADDTYIGFNTNWSNPAAWSNGAPPQTGENVLILPAVFSGTNTLTLDTTAVVNNVILGANGGGTTTLALQFNSVLANSISIMSSGQVTGNGRLQGVLDNAGNITSNSSLVLTVMGPSANSGTVMTTGAGNIQFNAAQAGILFDNTGGTIAAAGSGTNSVQINGLAVVGGNITTSGSNSSVQLIGATSLSDVTLSGNIQGAAQLSLQDVTFASGTFTQSGPFSLVGTITNNANWSLSNGLANISSAVALTGNGTITLSGVTVGSFGGSLSIGAGQTIQGSGTFNSLAVTNAGTIAATGALPLILNPQIGAAITNSGTMTATNGACLSIPGSNNTLYNYGGILSATGASAGNIGSTVDIGSVTVLGGQLTTDSSGSIRLDGLASLRDLTVSGNLLISSSTTLTNVVISGTVTQTGFTTLAGNITNNANWSSNGTISISNAVSLMGNGTITFNGTQMQFSGTSSLTVGACQTIAGSGTIAAFVSPVVNGGTIQANAANTLTITLFSSNSTIPSLTNTGTLTAANATLAVSGSTNTPVENAGGLMMATGSAGNLMLSCVTISDGVLSTDGAAHISLNTATLLNVNASGTLVGTGPVTFQNTTLAGSFTNTAGITTFVGTNTLNGNATLGQISLISPATINGNGTVTLQGTANSSNTTPSLTVGAGITITGSGTWSNTVPVINAGTFLAPAGTAVHISSASFINTGLISATGGGQVQFIGSVGNIVTNTGGVISSTGASPNGVLPSNITISGYTVTGGTLSTDGKGVIRLSNASLTNVVATGNIVLTGLPVLTNSTFGGNISQTSTVTVAGAITNNANWTVSSAFNDNIAGQVLLTGNGTMTLAGGNFNIVSSGAGLTIGAAQTLQGRATVSTSSLAFTNLGTINANSGAFTFNLNATGNLSLPSMTNAGTIAATNGGNFSISGSFESFLLNSNGTLSVSGSSNTSVASKGSLSQVTVYGGQMLTDAADSISLNYVNLQNVQLGGNFAISGLGSMLNTRLSGAIASNSGGDTVLNGGVTLNGTWTNSAAIEFSGSQMLAGNGIIALTGGTINSNLSVIALALPATESIDGYGDIGNNSYGLGIYNAGTIAAMPNPVGNQTVFSPLNFTFPIGFNSTNSGNLSALGGSTLNLNGNPGSSLDNTGGTISAAGFGAGGSPLSQVNISNLAISGGTLLTDGTGTIQFNGGTALADLSTSGNLVVANGTLGLRNVSLAGNLVQFGGTTTLVTGTVTNNANWLLSGGSAIAISRAQTIQGSGNIFMNGASIGSATGNGTTFSLLTIAGGSVIQGTGTIGDPAMSAIFNFGLIDANSTSPLGIVFNAPLTNNGDLSIEQFCQMTINAPFNAGSGIIHDNGTLTINGPITGAINQVGNGTLIINSSFVTTTPSAFGNALIVLNGTGNAITTAAGNGTLVVATGSSGKPGLVSDGLLLNTLSIDGALQIRPNSGSSGTSTLQHLTLAGSPDAWTGALDLTNHDLIVEITDASTLPTLLDQINYGISSAGGPGIHGGIFTSSPGMGIVLIDNSALTTPLTTFGGVPVGNNSILLAGALLGDANLDGHVDLSDLSVVLNNFGQPTANWLAGNFDHEQTVDLTDLSDVLNNFGQTASATGPGTAVGQQVAAAPEPASLLIVAAVPFLMTRRARSPRLRTN